MKLTDLVRWEHGPQLGYSIEQAVGASKDRLRWMRAAESDYKIPPSIYELTSFAYGTGY